MQSHCFSRDSSPFWVVGCILCCVVVREFIITALVLFSPRRLVRCSVMRSTNADVALVLATVATHTLGDFSTCGGLPCCAVTDNGARSRKLRKRAEGRSHMEYLPTLPKYTPCFSGRIRVVHNSHVHQSNEGSRD